MSASIRRGVGTEVYDQAEMSVSHSLALSSASWRLVLILIFILQNLQSAELHFLGFHGQ
jgi:uncharacterized integral membrane protein